MALRWPGMSEGKIDNSSRGDWGVHGSFPGESFRAPNFFC